MESHLVRLTLLYPASKSLMWAMSPKKPIQKGEKGRYISLIHYTTTRGQYLLDKAYCISFNSLQWEAGIPGAWKTGEVLKEYQNTFQPT